MRTNAPATVIILARNSRACGQPRRARCRRPSTRTFEAADLARSTSESCRAATEVWSASDMPESLRYARRVSLSIAPERLHAAGSTGVFNGRTNCVWTVAIPEALRAAARGRWC